METNKPRPRVYTQRPPTNLVQNIQPNVLTRRHAGKDSAVQRVLKSHADKGLATNLLEGCSGLVPLTAVRSISDRVLLQKCCTNGRVSDIRLLRIQSTKHKAGPVVMADTCTRDVASNEDPRPRRCG